MVWGRVTDGRTPAGFCLTLTWSWFWAGLTRRVGGGTSGPRCCSGWSKPLGSLLIRCYPTYLYYPTYLEPERCFAPLQAQRCGTKSSQSPATHLMVILYQVCVVSCLTSPLESRDSEQKCHKTKLNPSYPLKQGAGFLGLDLSHKCPCLFFLSSAWWGDLPFCLIDQF